MEAKVDNLREVCSEYQKIPYGGLILFGVVGLSAGSVILFVVSFWDFLNYLNEGGGRLSIYLFGTMLFSASVMSYLLFQFLIELNKHGWNAKSFAWLRKYWLANWCGRKVVVMRCKHGSVYYQIIQNPFWYKPDLFDGKMLRSGALRQIDTPSDPCSMGYRTCESGRVNLAFPVGGTLRGDKVIFRFSGGYGFEIERVWWSIYSAEHGLPMVRVLDKVISGVSRVYIDLFAALDVIYTSKLYISEGVWSFSWRHVVENYLSVPKKLSVAGKQIDNLDLQLREAIDDMWKLVQEFKRTTRLLSSTKEGLRVYLSLLQKLEAQCNSYLEINPASLSTKNRLDKCKSLIESTVKELDRREERDKAKKARKKKAKA